MSCDIAMAIDHKNLFTKHDATWMKFGLSENFLEASEKDPIKNVYDDYQV